MNELASRAVSGGSGPGSALAPRKPEACPCGFSAQVRRARWPSEDSDGHLGHEIAESERFETERRDLKARVQHSQKLESLGVLAGAVAHDFNNYLTGILGNAGMVLHKLGAEHPCRPLVEEIERAAQHAAALSKQMLAYSGHERSAAQPVELTELIDEMAPLLRISISKKAALRLDLGERLPSIAGDPGQLRQVIMNLVTNASEALSGGNGYISLSAGVLAADPDYLAAADFVADEELTPGPCVYLEVSDTGCGMDDATRGQIFDPSFTTKSPGRGLGLAAVLGIVRDHGGAILLDSVPGRGTTFKVLFAAGDLLPPRAAAEGAGVASLRGHGTVLVVDDEEIIRDVARHILEEFGYEVLIAEDGLHAVEVFQHRADEIAAVLLDVTMPRLDGAETFLELRRIRPGVKIVLSSGFDSEASIDRFLSLDAVGFIQKPYRPRELVEKICAVTRENLKSNGGPKPAVPGRSAGDQ